MSIRTAYSRVLFLTPFSPGRFFGGVRPPVGMGYLEEYLRVNGIATSALDMNLGYSMKHVLRQVKLFQPDLIGITLMTYQFHHTYGIISRLKKEFPSIAIVVGGPHVSAYEGDILTQCANIDFAIAGEGELSLHQLCAGHPSKDIPGLFVREGNEIRAGSKRVYSHSLNDLPFPRYLSYDLHKYPEIEISTSRGCPHPCIFCAVSSIMGKKIRFREVNSIGDELSYFYHTHGIRSFQIGDDNFIADKGRTIALCDEIVRRNLKGVLLRCGQGIRGDLIDKEVLVAMKYAGFRHLGIGVESGSDHVLSTIRKGEHVEAIDRGIKLATEMGFDVSLLFVVGTPGETLEDVDKSIALAKKYPVMKAFFFNLIPFPGTALFDWVNARKAWTAQPDDLFNRRDELKLRSVPFFETADMTKEDRQLALEKTESVSKDIQVKTMERKLMRFGIVGRILARTARYDTLERIMVRQHFLRHIIDRLVFRTHQRFATSI